MATAISAQGATLLIEDSNVGVADVPIELISSFTGFDGEASEIDTTHLLSTSKQKITGLQDWGSFSFEWFVDWVNAPGQDRVRAVSASGETVAFELQLPDGSKAQWSGNVKHSTALNGGVDAALTGSVSITIDGEVTITAA